jgi:hypothetical protein
VPPAIAVVDARGAAGAEHGVAALSTAGWLRAALRMSPAGAGRAVRTARALHRGPAAGPAAAAPAHQPPARRPGSRRGRAAWPGALGAAGLWLSATYDGMVAVDGLLDPEAGETVRAALLPLARPARMTVAAGSARPPPPLPPAA